MYSAHIFGYDIDWFLKSRRKLDTWPSFALLSSFSDVVVVWRHVFSINYRIIVDFN
jgi:hypothetical protein